MFKKSKVLSCFLLSILAPQIQAKPASKDYVQVSINALRTELTSQFSVYFNFANKSMNQLSLQINQSQAKVTQTNKRLAELQKQMNSLAPTIHHLGDLVEGGLVFYLDASQQHGLVVSLRDLGEPVAWRNGEGGDRVTNAQAKGLYSGETNTRLIIAQQTIDQHDGDFAALSAANYQVGADGATPCKESMTAKHLCYGGWYLPSLYELILLHSAFKQLGRAELHGSYWSSTEVNATQAMSLDSDSGEPRVLDKFTPLTIRAIHHF